MFDYGGVLDLALQETLAGVTDRGHRRVPTLPVTPALQPLLPGGLRRGSTVSVSGSMSLLLAVLGAASADGAWCALVGLPHLGAEAADEYGIDLARLVVVPQPGEGWTRAVGALLDAVDVVATCPPTRVAPGDVRRLAARTRTRDAVLMPFAEGTARTWPGAEVRLHLQESEWHGIGDGAGRLRRRRVSVTVEGRGQAARARSVQLWLPADGGGVEAIDTNIDTNVVALRAAG